MTRWRPIARVALAMAVVGAVLGIGYSSDVEADPEVCGYVRYSTEDSEPTETVPYVPYCERPCFPGLVVPTGHVGTVAWEGLVCVKGL